MKFDSTGLAPSGKRALTLRVGEHELEIIKELLINAIKHTPRTKEAAKTIERMRAMVRCINKPEVQEWIDKGYQEKIKEAAPTPDSFCQRMVDEVIKEEFDKLGKTPWQYQGPVVVDSPPMRFTVTGVNEGYRPLLMNDEEMSKCYFGDQK
jgi:hypothetical protein